MNSQEIRAAAVQAAATLVANDPNFLGATDALSLVNARATLLVTTERIKEYIETGIVIPKPTKTITELPMNRLSKANNNPIANTTLETSNDPSED